MPNPRAFPGVLRTDTGRKLVRYGLASVINVIVAEAVLAFAFGLLHWPARRAAVLAAVVAASPAYWLARRWVWGRSGRSHLMKEIVPFWALALTGMVLTTWVAGLAESAGAKVTGNRLGQTVILMGSVLAVSIGFWAVRFVLLNGILFADREPTSSSPTTGTPGR
jgi:putative flippase GtrA